MSIETRVEDHTIHITGYCSGDAYEPPQGGPYRRSQIRTSDGSSPETRVAVVEGLKDLSYESR